MNGIVQRLCPSHQTTAVISDKKSVAAMGSWTMQIANKLGIHVVPIEFLDAVKTCSDPLSLIKDMKLNPWDCIKSDSEQYVEPKIQTWKSEQMTNLNYLLKP